MLSQNKLVGVFAAVFVAAVAGMAVLLLGGGGEDASGAPDDGTYSNSDLRYRFQYPDAWPDARDRIKLNVPDGTSVLDYVAVGEYEDDTAILNGVQVSVVKINQPVASENLERQLLELDSLFKQQAEQARGTLDEPKWVELGGLQARQYVLEFVYGTVQAATAQTVTFFGDRQYSVACTGRATTFDEKVLQGCEQALQSFRFD